MVGDKDGVKWSGSSGDRATGQNMARTAQFGSDRPQTDVGNEAAARRSRRK
jgi:hypothetical protein